MQTFTHLSTEIGHSVLVKGKAIKTWPNVSDGPSRTWGSTVKRIWDPVPVVGVDIEGEKLRKVDVWIPEKLAYEGAEGSRSTPSIRAKVEQSE